MQGRRIIVAGAGLAGLTAAHELARHGPSVIFSRRAIASAGASGRHARAWRPASWEDDPLVPGGYAFLDPGFDPAWRPLLSQRAGRIVFAGEHTSADHPGCMEGAVESGLRAARELIERAER